MGTLILKSGDVSLILACIKSLIDLHISLKCILKFDMIKNKRETISLIFIKDIYEGYIKFLNFFL